MTTTTASLADLTPTVLFLLVVFRCLLLTCCLSPVPYIHHPGAVYHVHRDNSVHTLAWAVRLRRPTDGDTSSDLDSLVLALTSHVGLVVLGKIGAIDDVFLLVHPLYFDRQENSTDGGDEEQLFFNVKRTVESYLDARPEVVWFGQEVMRSRVKRSNAVQFTDPFFPRQWHLHNTRHVGMDINVTGLWERNITGRGVTVCVVDDGLEWSNPDLRDNYCAEGSWDLNDDDNDPMPSLGGKNEHGTRCAGEIAAVRNSVCGVGVAFEARISGVKVLDGQLTDSLEATAFNKNLNVNDVYSCSWGPEDDGRTVDGPHFLSNLAIEYGVNEGRGGYGTIYVVASGNGGRNGDNCNYDGYANSIYMVTIGAVDEVGHVPYYAEECASMLAVTFSSGGRFERSIVTTDWSSVDGSGCTTEHTGTSAAAPLATAIIALALQVRPCLTWRDVQYVIILSALQIDAGNSSWHSNSAGLHHSNHYGFGLLTAWRFVAAAKSWSSVSWMTTYSSRVFVVSDVVPSSPYTLDLTHSVSRSDLQSFRLLSLEYVCVRVTVRHPSRGRLEFRLRCPSGSESVLATPRWNDNSTSGLDMWTFSTVRCWGEVPVGQYVLAITDHGLSSSQSLGSVVQWQLVLHGTALTREQFQQRKRSVLEAIDGHGLDSEEEESAPCRPPPAPPLGDVGLRLSAKLLKVILLTGTFLVLIVVFETIEYACCSEARRDNSSLEEEEEEAEGLLPLEGCTTSLEERVVTDHQEDNVRVCLLVPPDELCAISERETLL